MGRSSPVNGSEVRVTSGAIQVVIPVILVVRAERRSLFTAVQVNCGAA